MVKLQYLPLVAVLRSASLLRIAVCQIAPLPALLVPAPKERLFSLRYVGDASHTCLLYTSVRAKCLCTVRGRDAAALHHERDGQPCHRTMWRRAVTAG